MREGVRHVHEASSHRGREIAALDGVNLTIRQGEMVALIGAEVDRRVVSALSVVHLTGCGRRAFST